MERMKKMVNAIITISPIVPIILLIVTIGLSVNAYKKLNNYIECKGTIIGFYENTSRGRLSSDQYKKISPIVTYDIDGKKYEFKSNFGTSSMKVGDAVKVMYSEDDYSKAVIKTGLSFAPIITGSLCFFFTIACVILFIIKSKGLI